MNIISIIFMSALFNGIFLHGMESVDANFAQESNYNQVNLIEERIKNLMRFRVSKEYNELLTCKTIGELCKCYTQEDKDIALKNLMKCDETIIEKGRSEGKKITQCLKSHYEAIRFPIITLICAGADPAIKFFDRIDLLGMAVEFNDIHMVKKLFEDNVNPNGMDDPFSRPILFSVTTQEMAQILIDNGIDVHNPRLREPGSLRTLLRDKFPLELIEFYLEKGVGQRGSDDFCWELLWEITSYGNFNNWRLLDERASQSKNKIDNVYKKAEFLCKDMPQDRINRLKGSDTLIDSAQWKLRCNKHTSLLAEFYENLITLYRQQGGLAAGEVYKKLALHAEEYNQTHPTLSALPQEILGDICSYYQLNRQKMGESCENSIKNFMRLRNVCKKLHHYLTSEKIGDLCKNYAQEDKNNALCTLVDTMDRYTNKPSHTYAKRRFPALVLVCAGANPNNRVEFGRYLLEHAVHNNDEHMVKTLFKHNVDSHKNGREYSYHRLDSAVLVCKTREMAQIFIDNKVKLNDSTYPNVLWRMLGDDYSCDVFNCCAEEVDVTSLYNPCEVNEQLRDYSDKKEKKNYICLLHKIASSDDKYTLKNSNQLLEKAKFLLVIMPKDMVNLLCEKGTPIDVAQHNYRKARKENSPDVQFYEKLVCLYREHGGLSGFTFHKKLTAEIEQYNQAHVLLNRLSLEDFKDKIVLEQNQEKLLVETIKNCVRLRGVCKKFYLLFTDEAIGDLCKDYAQDDKNKALKKVLSEEWYHKSKTRSQKLILICAGADPNMTTNKWGKSVCLLEKAVTDNDERMVELLFAHKADLTVSNPALYTTKKMAQLFIDNGGDVHVPVDNFPNVLWHVIEDNYPSDLLEFYLKQGVDANKLSNFDYYGSKQDLLSYFTDISEFNHYRDYFEDRIRKAEFLINAMPEKINTIRGWRTLVDIAQDRYGEYIGSYQKARFYEALIALYRKHGSLTAEELQQQAL